MQVMWLRCFLFTQLLLSSGSWVRAPCWVHAFGVFSGGSDGKESTCNAGDPGSNPGSGRSPGEGHGNWLQPVFLPGESYGQRNLVGYSPQCRTRMSD